MGVPARGCDGHRAMIFLYRLLPVTLIFVEFAYLNVGFLG
jgi:hypothetical protein